MRPYFSLTSVQTVSSNPILRYACACLWAMAPAPIIQTFIGASILANGPATMGSSLIKRYFALFAAVAASVALGACKHTPPAGVAAEVNGQPISYDKLEKTYHTQYPQVPENANEDLVQSQKLELLGSLITNEIMLQGAERLGLQAVD